MNSFQQLYDVLSALSLVQWAVLVVFWAASHLLGYAVFFRWVIRRQWKLHQHLKRPIVMLQPVSEKGDLMPGGDLSTEFRLIKDNGFLNVNEATRDYRTFNPVIDHCIVVLGYRPGMAGIAELLTRLKSNHTPLVVYTYGNNRIADEDKAQFDTYPYAILANFPLTLLNHIFATAASYPYDRK